MKTYTIRLLPSQEQISQLNKLSDIRMDVWNTLIDIQQKEYEQKKLRAEKRSNMGPLKASTTLIYES